MTPAEIRQAIRFLAGMGIHTARDMAGKTLRKVKA